MLVKVLNRCTRDGCIYVELLCVEVSCCSLLLCNYNQVDSVTMCKKDDAGKRETLSTRDPVNEGKQQGVQLEDNLCSLAVNPVLTYIVTAYVQGVPIQLMVDTGAAVSLLGKDVWNMLSRTSNCTLEQWSGG